MNTQEFNISSWIGGFALGAAITLLLTGAFLLPVKQNQLAEDLVTGKKKISYVKFDNGKTNVLILNTVDSNQPKPEVIEHKTMVVDDMMK